MLWFATRPIERKKEKSMSDPFQIAFRGKGHLRNSKAPTASSLLLSTSARTILIGGSNLKVTAQ